MPIVPETQKIFEEMDFVKEIYQNLIKVLPSFDITDKKWENIFC